MLPPRPLPTASPDELWAYIKALEIKLRQQSIAHQRQLEDIAEIMQDVGIKNLSSRS